jgi:hypothetical protein
MANSIFSLLNFPSSDPVIAESTQTLSANVLTQMNLMPSLVNSWQQGDMANSDTGGYFQNPLGVSINTASSTANTIVAFGTVTGTTPQISNLLISVANVANALSHTTPDFLYLTNRLSNVEEIGSDMDTPHFKSATGYGKIVMYIVNKTDNIQNNAPMIGSFGSILAANVINSNANTFITYANLYANTITVGIDGTNSSISLANAQILSNSVNSIYQLMTNYIQQDTDFYQNLKDVVNSYSAVSTFNSLGQTENDLIINYIGTDKIKARLSS